MECDHSFVESKTLALVIKQADDAFMMFTGRAPSSTPVEFCIHCGVLRISTAMRAAQNLEQGR